ncbi:proline--tRNA ligase [Clostridia bacterium]|nr:proline--tRNA ligase [Clostridia bacterium]
MKTSNLLIPTLKETPADAEVRSHQLLVRAGMIKKLSQGVYSYLPLGWKVMNKISNIVREEMNKRDCQEVMLPIIQPAELWIESGRWEVYGKELIRFKDRHDNDYCLGPTHEEVITDLVRSFVSSYKQLPLNIYQIQNKYRDERRPRFGLIRSREFLMKDGYSFDKDEAGLDKTYKAMYEGYSAIFDRCGLSYRAVEADSGAIGGSNTHEFMVMAESGEAGIVYCPECDYSANTEKALMDMSYLDPEEEKAMEKVLTPNQKTIAEVCEFLDAEPAKSIKALLYRAVFDDKEEYVVAFVRGDREANEIKIQNALGALAVDMDTNEEIIEQLGIQPGFIGPVGLNNVTVLVDEEITRLKNLVCGANEKDYHIKNVNYGRDFTCERVVDIKEVKKGDPCPKCQAELIAARGTEVGQVFKLGTKYSESMGATYLDENGKSQPMVMGCYGIGIGRTMQASVEQNNDESGIIWPKAIAPFEVIVIPAVHKKQEQVDAANQIYDELLGMGVDVLLDDSKERTGVKFANSELIGYPIRITAGKKIDEGKVEIFIRSTGEKIDVPVEDAAKKASQILNTLA